MSARLVEIAVYFLRLGVLGFGGPLALMAAVQRDLVEKREWTSREKFAQALALIKALPGPTGTQVAIYMGQVGGGRLGGAVAGICLILPSFLMMLGLGAFYNTVEVLAWSKPLLFGMQATALGVIAESVWKLTGPYRRETTFWVIAVLAALATGLRPSFEPIVILGFGLLGALALRLQTKSAQRKIVVSIAPLPLLAPLMITMFKAGAFVFGTGLAIVPMLAHDVVEKHAWLTQQQFMDALSFGQITPGPVVITATFIGFKVAGVLGALLATICIFAPAFFNILTWFPLAERALGNSPYTRRFVMWAVAAVVGSIVVTIARLGAQPPAGGAAWIFWALGCAGLIAALKTRMPVWGIIPLGGVLAVLLGTDIF